MSDRTCKPIDDIIDVKVEVQFDVDVFIRKGERYMEKYQKALENAVKNLEDLLSEHKSSPKCSFWVVPEKQLSCSMCGNKWETEQDEDGEYCVHCGANYVEDNAPESQ